MAVRWRSSFFYFFFAILGGTFSSLLLCLYYSTVFRITKSFRLFFLKTFLVSLLAQWFVYSAAASAMVAPYPLRSLLNNPSAAAGSSFLGLLIAWLFLFLSRRRKQVDLFLFIQKEQPLIPSLLCCAAGGLLNILWVTLIWYVELNW